MHAGVACAGVVACLTPLTGLLAVVAIRAGHSLAAPTTAGHVLDGVLSQCCLVVGTVLSSRCLGVTVCKL